MSTFPPEMRPGTILECPLEIAKTQQSVYTIRSQQSVAVIFLAGDFFLSFLYKVYEICGLEQLLYPSTDLGPLSVIGLYTRHYFILQFPSGKLRQLAQFHDEGMAWTQADLELNSTSASISCVTLVKSLDLSELHCPDLYKVNNELPHWSRG